MDSNHLQFLYKLAHMFEYILGVIWNIYSLIAAIYLGLLVKIKHIWLVDCALHL